VKKKKNPGILLLIHFCLKMIPGRIDYSHMKLVEKIDIRWLL